MNSAGETILNLRKENQKLRHTLNALLRRIQNVGGIVGNPYQYKEVKEGFMALGYDAYGDEKEKEVY